MKKVYVKLDNKIYKTPKDNVVLFIKYGGDYIGLKDYNNIVEV